MITARKILPFLICLLGFNVKVMAQSRILDQKYAKLAKKELDPPYDIYSEIEADYFENSLQVDERRSFLDQIIIAKSLLIDGHTTDAILVLNRLSYKTRSYRKKLLINRFLAIAYFADTRPKEAFDTLQGLSNNASWFYQNCTIRMVTALSLPKEKKRLIQDIYKRCINHARINELEKNETWTSLVLDHKVNGYVKDKTIEGLFKTNRIEDIKAVLKYGLYYSKHEQILKFYNLIQVEFFADPIVRTLVAGNLYNSGEYEKALKLASALNNSNTNKLKAFQEVKKRNYKTAYSHFISNLLSKPFSIENNQLILTSSWLSRNYKNAITALSKIPVSVDYEREKDLLRVNLLLKEGKLSKALYLMNNLDIKYNRKLPYEAAILSSYLKLINGDERWKNLSDQSCLNKNVISCWLHMQSKIWPDFTNDVLNKKRQMKPKDIQNRLNWMIAKKQDKQMKEPILIYQKDIYELDLMSNPKIGQELREAVKMNNDNQH